MKTAKYILNSYGWTDTGDVLQSFFPSMKYSATILVISFSAFTAQLELLLGFQHYTLIAFLVGAFIELSSGIYASVVVNKESFESSKFTRFLFKFIFLMVGLYMVNQFAKEWEVKNPLLHEVFQWVYAFMFTIGALEYLFSVLENYASAQKKPKDYYIKTISKKVSDMLGTNEEKAV